MKTKKFLSVFITLAMLMSLLPMCVSVSAETPDKDYSHLIVPAQLRDTVGNTQTIHITDLAENTVLIERNVPQNIDTSLFSDDSIERFAYAPIDAGTEDLSEEWTDFAPFGISNGDYEFTMMLSATQKRIPVMVHDGMDGGKQYAFIGWGAGFYSNAGRNLIVDIDPDNKCSVPLQSTGTFLQTTAASTLS